MIDELMILDPIVIITNSRQPKALVADSLEAMFKEKGFPVRVSDNANDAVKMAQQLIGNGTVLVATGSLFVAAEVREVIKELEPELYSDLQKRGK